MNKPQGVGILIVHGIGNQVRGQTLVDYGDPLIQFLQKWVEGANKNREKLVSRQGCQENKEIADNLVASQLACFHVKISEAVLSDNNHGEPAHAIVSIDCNDEKKSENWIIAESHWADSFPKPDSANVTLWLMKIIPWVWISFFSRRLRLTATEPLSNWSSRIAQVFLFFIEAFVTVIASPLVLIFELLLLILLIMAPIPIPFIKKFVASIQRILSSIIGDSYIFTSSPIRREAIIKKAGEDLRWLESQCENVVILAHSQGAAVAYLTLRKHLSNKIRLLVTFGSGLHKLTQLSTETNLIKELIAFLSIVSAITLPIAIYLLFEFTPKTRDDALDLNLLSVFVAAVIFLVATVGMTMYEETGEIEKWFEEYTQGNRLWADFYASWDPVPNGPLFLKSKAPLESTKIYNKNSLLLDHTTYQNNLDEFYAELINLIERTRVTGLPIAHLTPKDDWARARAKIFRRELSFFHLLDRVFLDIAMIIVLLDSDKVLMLGGRFNSLVNRMCLAWVENLTATSDTCLNISSSFSGAILVIIGWLILKLFVQYCADSRESINQDLLFRRTEYVSIGTLKNIRMGIIFRHYVSSAALTTALQLHSSHIYRWVQADIQSDMQKYYNFTYLQGLLFGFAVAVLLSHLEYRRSI